MATYISVDDIYYNEGDTTATFVVRLAGAVPATDILLDYQTLNGTALAGTDYTATTGQLLIPAGSALNGIFQIQIPVQPAGDGAITIPQGFSLRLGTTSADAFLGDSIATALQIDADASFAALPTLSIGHAVVDETAGFVTVAVTLSAPSASAVSVDFSTADATAVAGTDYTALSGTLNFAPGHTSATITLAIAPDAVVEGREIFSVQLANAVGAQFAPAPGSDRAHVIIQDASAAAVAAPIFEVQGSTMSETAGYVDFIVALSAPGSSAITVDYATADGAGANAAFTTDVGADQPASYVAASGKLTFAPGEVSRIVRVFTLDNTLVDHRDLRAFTLNLSNATGGAQLLGATSAAGVLVDDEAGADFSVDTPLAVNTNTNTALGEVLIGTEYTDSIRGAAGNDLLYGQGGDDYMEGLDGNDTYVVEDVLDVVAERAGNGSGTSDTVISHLAAYALSSDAVIGFVENLVLAGTGNSNGNGNSLANRITGNSGNNRLEGAAGIDTLVGGGGDDTYILGPDADVVIEGLDSGIDTVFTTSSYSLGANVENLVLQGTSAINGIGNAQANSLTGNSSANVLDGGAGDDLLTGGLGNDTYHVDSAGDVVVEEAGGGIDTVVATASTTLAAEVEDLLLAGTAHLNGSGNSLNNVVTGNSGNNLLSGQAGNDMLLGNAGNDTLDGGLGVDSLDGGTGDDTYRLDGDGDIVIEAAGVDGGIDTVLSTTSHTLAANLENLVLGGTANLDGTGNTQANALTGNAAANTLDGGAGADTLSGGDGNDSYVVDNVGDLVIETNAAAAGGVDRVYSLLGAYTLGANIEEGSVAAAGAANLAGNALANTLYAGAGDNVLDGAAGIDTASYAFATAAVSVSLALATAQATGGSGADTLVSIDNLTGSQFGDNLAGDAAANTLDGGAGADTLGGGDGNDTYVVDHVGDLVVETSAAAAGGVDRVNSLLSAYTLTANVEQGRVSATGAADLTGNALANTLYAGTGSNVLDGAGGIDTVSYAFASAAVNVSLAITTAQVTGGSGADILLNVENLTGSQHNDNLAGNAGVNTLDGGAGADTLSGGDGSDTYVVDNVGDLVVETSAAAAGGVDRVNSLLSSYTLTANVEQGRVSASGAANLTGNTLANTLYAGTGNNVLDGAGGLDTASYAFATTAVSVSLASTTAQATGGSGTDTLVGIENLTGSNLADNLAGNAAANTLDGGVGADTLSGGDGNDLYVVDNVGDLVVETTPAAAGGLDRVNSLLASYTLTDAVEEGSASTAAAANLTGNTLNNTLYAGAGDNVLDGATGVDTVSYLNASAAVRVSLALATAQLTGGSGSDTLVNVENLTGSRFGDNLAGNAGTNTLDGGAGADTLSGGEGSDTYVVDNVGDLVVETNAAAAGGVDRVNSLLSSYTLTANVEQGRVSTSGAANLTGNALANTLYAGTGNNVLDGAGGLDTASYAFATTAVSVSLAITTAQATGGSGTDTLVGIENLTGSNLADNLAGNAAANTLDGGLGADTLSGGDGNDLYVVDNVGDLVVETNPAAAGGLDRVNSRLASYTLTDAVEEGAVSASGAASLTGNTLNNTLYAGAGDNVLDGAAGVDTVSYLNASAAVSVSLALATAQLTGGSGSDTLVNVENLTGSRFADNLAGNAGVNTLDGGAGADTLSGGDGNDIYLVDNIGDLVVETNAVAASGGTDLVNSRLAAYTLTDNVEAGRIVLTGAADLSGNALNNTLYAGAGNNVIDGGAGTDTLSYFYASAGVTLDLALATAQATGGSGVETVANIENLLGSNFADHLAGNAGANSLSSGAGADTLAGGLGNDTLLGGAGNDVFVFDAALNALTNVDRIGDYGAGDVIALDNDVFTALGAPGALGAAQFFSGAGLTGSTSAAQGAGIYYNTTAGALYYDADGFGGVAGVKFATVTGLPVLGAGSFDVRE